MTDPQFQTQLHITYTFAEDGTSYVVHKYTLTNLTSDSAATSYEFDIIDALPDNLTAYDALGQLKLEALTSGPASTRVIIPFNHITAGKGKSYEFFISFTGPVSSKADGLWKVSLPLPALNTPSQLTAQLTIPAAFGHSLSLSPTPTSVTDGTTVSYFFDPQSTSVGSIYAIFGQKKLIGFELLFAPQANHTELPADAANQSIFLTSIIPKPENITATQDGRWLATFSTPPASVKVTGYALLETGSDIRLPTEATVRLSDLSTLPLTSPAPPHISWSKPLQILPFPLFSSHLTVQNPNPQAIYHLPLKLSVTNLTLSDTASDITLPTLPPFGSVTVPVKLVSSPLPANGSLQLSVSAGIQHVTYNVEASRLLIWYVTLVIFISLTFLAVGRLAGHAWSLHLQRRRR